MQPTPVQPTESRQPVSLNFLSVADLIYVSQMMVIDRGGYDDTRTDPNREIILTIPMAGEPYERTFVGEQADQVWNWFLLTTGAGRVKAV